MITKHIRPGFQDNSEHKILMYQLFFETEKTHYLIIIFKPVLEKYKCLLTALRSVYRFVQDTLG
jgi:hypothetical protein